MANKTCVKCGNMIEGDVYKINGMDYCKTCSNQLYRESISKAYPTAESKLIGIIEHLNTLNYNLEKQDKKLSSIDNRIGCLLTFLIVAFVLGVVAGFLSAL